MVTPYLIFGKAYDTNGTTVLGSVTVRIRNENTGELVTTTTSALGEWVYDLQNLSSGYTTEHKVTAYVFYQNAEGEATFNLSSSEHNKNITLVTVTDSSLVYYTTVQNVWDELDELGSSDIKASRVIKAIQRAESEIEYNTDIHFRPVLVHGEVYDFNERNSWKDVEQLKYFSNISRWDYMQFSYNNVIRLKNTPLINPITQLNGALTAGATEVTVDSTSDFPSSGRLAIYESTGIELLDYTSKTSTKFLGCTRGAGSTTAAAHDDNDYITMMAIWTNGGTGGTTADSWAVREQNTGGGGDYLVYETIGKLSFVQNKPYYGKRAFKITYTHGYVSTPKIVERLATLLAVRDVIITKQSRSQFDSIDSISIENIRIEKGASASYSYMRMINEEIGRLWTAIGTFKSKVM